MALDLLHDRKTLRHLWRTFDRIENDDDTSSKLQGLLDGVEPLEDSGERGDLDSTLVTLADMAVGCLIKGAYAMLPTFCLFLEKDNHYDATRASLMLAATMARVPSIDSELVSAMMGEGYNINVKSSPSGEDLVWLVRCLLQVGVARDSLKDTLMLLNAIVPAELRNQCCGNVPKYSVPSMEQCKKLVTLILRSSPTR